uniref:L27 domain-containing protein n=1 Tax=Timema douglasi TaxID=61478 RepID=A0A7R8ZBS0_TIMDO|nr:unnamed protein product [Timema douglasi]
MVVCKIISKKKGAVSLVLDSLDDIHCLQEPPLNDRDFLHSVLEDRQLHALLEWPPCRVTLTAWELVDDVRSGQYRGIPNMSDSDQCR